MVFVAQDVVCQFRRAWFSEIRESAGQILYTQRLRLSTKGILVRLERLQDLSQVALSYNETDGGHVVDGALSAQVGRVRPACCVFVWFSAWWAPAPE